MMWIWFIAAVVLLMVLVPLMRQRNAPQTEPPPEASPLEILEKRYARGELDREEFEQKKQDLEETGR